MSAIASLLRKATFVDQPEARSGEVLYWNPAIGQLVVLTKPNATQQKAMAEAGWSIKEQGSAERFSVLKALQAKWPDLHSAHPDLLGSKLTPQSVVELLSDHPEQSRGRLARWVIARSRALGLAGIAEAVLDSGLRIESQHPLAPSANEPVTRLASRDGSFAFMITGNEIDGYRLTSFSAVGGGFVTREDESIEAILRPSGEWSKFDWDSYLALCNSERITASQFEQHPGFASSSRVLHREEPATANAHWLALVEQKGLGALLGEQHQKLRRQFLDEPRAAWIDLVCDQHNLRAEPMDNLRQLVDAWMALKSTDEQAAEFILPAMRATVPEFSALSDADLTSLLRQAFQAIVRHAGSAQGFRPKAPGLARYAPAKTTMVAESVRAVLKAHYGPAVIDVLEQAGRLSLVNTEGELPVEVRSQYTAQDLSLITGVTIKQNVTLVANMMTPEMVPFVFLHEIGEHAGLAAMLGPDYGRLVDQFDKLLQQQDTYATWAAMRVPKNTKRHHIPSERLAYLVERVASDQHARKGGDAGYQLGQECLSNLRTWLFRTPTFRWLEGAGVLGEFTLSAQDMASLAREAVNHYTNSIEPGTAPDTNQWNAQLDQRQLNQLFALEPQQRQAELEAMAPEASLAYLYSLTVMAAPGVGETVGHFKATLAEIAGGLHTTTMQVIAGEILAEARALETRNQLNDQLERSGFAMWVDDTATPDKAQMHFLTRSPSEPEKWQHNHYRSGLGPINSEVLADPMDAFINAHNASFMVPDGEAPAVLQRWASLRQAAQLTDSAEFKAWFGNSQAVTSDGEPLVLYHGTGSDFDTFSASKHRSVLNNKYQGDGFHFTASPSVAAKYADASRNHMINKDAMIAAVDRQYPPIIADMFKTTLNDGYAKLSDMTVEELKQAIDQASLIGIDIDDLLDLAKHVEGNRYHAGAQPNDFNYELFDMFMGHRNILPDEVRDLAVALGLGDALPNQAVIPVYIRAENVLRTSDQEAARTARENGYDAVVYSGPDIIDGEPEWVVFDPTQIKSAIANSGSFDPANPSFLLRSQSTVQDSFKQWFGDSQVVNDDGSPKVVYHGSTVWSRPDGRQLGDIEAFDRLASVNIVRRQHSIDTLGSWFSERHDEAGAINYSGPNGVIYPVYLNIQNPWVPASFDEILNRMHLTEGRAPGEQNPKGLGSTEGLRNWLKANDYDGLRVGPFGDGGEFGEQTAWIALEANQIKSAIGNRGTFDSTSNDIRQDSAQPVASSFGAWFDGSVITDRAGEPLVAYHGTDNDFAAFKDGVAYFSPRWDYSYVQNSAFVMPVLLSIKNPYRPENQSEIETIRSNPARLEELKAQGFDGMVWAKADDLMRGASGWGNDLPQIVAFYPNQIKSAVGNRGTFDPSSSNILQRAAQNVGMAFENWFAGSPVVTENGAPLVMYHGTSTAQELTSFVPGGTDLFNQKGDQYGVASYFTSSPDEASSYAGTEGAVIPVYITGNILNLDAPLSPADAYCLTAFASSVMRPSDKARFDFGRATAEFADADASREFYEQQKAIWERLGDKMDRALPMVDKAGDKFVIHYTDFNAPTRITSGEDARRLFAAIGWDNIPAAGYDGLMMTRDSGAKWVVMHRPGGTVKSVFNLGTFDRFNVDIRFDAAQKPTDAFTNWFGDSKAVDEQGNPLVLYHGSFASFDTFDASLHDDGAFHFGSAEAAQNRLDYWEDKEPMGQNILPVYLSVQNPLVIDYDPIDDVSWSELIAPAIEDGHDGIRYPNKVEGGESWVVFKPNQIKSIFNRGTFYPSNTDIRFETALTRQGAFSRWFGDSQAVNDKGDALVLYHGTASSFNEFGELFDTHLGGQNFGRKDYWHYLTPNADEASRYAENADSRNLYLFSDPNSARANVMPVYASLQNPLVVQPDDRLPEFDGVAWFDLHREEMRAKYLEGTFDGIIIKDRSGALVSVATEYPSLIKSVFNRGTFDPFSDDIRFSFAGIKAQTSLRELLADAQLRIASGQDAEAVRKETGWFQGVDQKWRFEIDDSASNLLPLREGHGGLQYRSSTLDEILDHPTLFTAYPYLRGMLTTIEINPAETNPRAVHCMAVPATEEYFGREEELKVYAQNTEHAHKMLLHEIQHSIQDFEGFARGGQPKDFTDTSELTAVEQYQRLAGEVEARNTETRSGMSAEQRARISPFETADTAPADTIIRWNGVEHDPALGTRTPIIAEAILGAVKHREGVEVILAKEAQLDMSREARLSRASALGFDTSKSWFHGSIRSGFTSFDTEHKAKVNGTGCFFTDAKPIAVTYSDRNVEAPVFTAQQLLDDPDIAEGAVEVEREWAVLNGDGEIVETFSTRLFDTAKDVLAQYVNDASESFTAEERFTIYVNGSRECEHVPESDALAVLDKVEIREPGIYEVFIRAKDVFELDWKGGNWDQGPSETVWNALDENGDVHDTCYEESALADFRVKYPGYQIEEAENVFAEDTNEAARIARDMGCDALLIKNVVDEGPNGQGYSGDANVMVVFDANNIRLVNAAFNPTDSYSADIRLRSAAETQNQQTESFSFKRWFGKSLATAPSGAPLVMYHGTGDDFTEFGSTFSWASSNPALANDYAEMRYELYGKPAQVMPVYMRVTAPFDADRLGKADRLTAFFNEAWNQAEQAGRAFDHTEANVLIAQIRQCAWREESGPYYRVEDLWSNAKSLFGLDGEQSIKRLFQVLGFDSISFTEQGHKTYGVLSANQMKSAIGNNGEFALDSDDIRFQLAYHGTPHQVDKFALDKINSGEGNQSYGWGLYFAEAREVAEFYRNTLTIERGFTYNGHQGLTREAVQTLIEQDFGTAYIDGNIRPSGIADRIIDELVYYPGTTEAPRFYKEGSARLAAYNMMKALIGRSPDAGNLYQVSIPNDSTFLYWDKPVEEQPEVVQAAFKNGYGEFGRYAGLTGGQAYNICVMQMGAKQASLMLNSLGIRGCKYLDLQHRNLKDGTYNFVVWDEAAIRITMINDMAVANDVQFREQQATGEPFDRWFRDSKIVDENGNPRVVYHGTAIQKTKFRREGGAAGVGAYFTPYRSVAEDYAELDAIDDGDEPTVMEVYLSIQNPYHMTGTESFSITPARRDELEALGYDGVVSDDNGEIVAFRPEQIKSAIGNKGTFSTASNDIRFSLAEAGSSFSSWFGGSKVVDSSGEPLVVYRGGPTEDWESGAEINVFRSSNGPWAGFFTDSTETANRFASAQYAMTRNGGKPAGVFPVYLSMQNPLEVDAQGRPARDFQIDASVLGKTDHPVREQMLSGQYDGLILRNTEDEGDVFVPLNPQQIKSAIGNNGAFDPANADIRFSMAETTASDTFKAWMGGSYVTDDNGRPLLVFRGEHGTSDAVFQSRLGSLSFGDLQTAITYATAPNNLADAAVEPRVIPAYLSITRPVIVDKDDPFIDFSVIVEAIGYDKARQIAIELDGHVRNTSYFEGRPGVTVAEALDADGDELFQMYVDAYPVFDEHRYVEWFKAAGFDGAIHGGNGVSHAQAEFKVFLPEQVLHAEPVSAFEITEQHEFTIAEASARIEQVVAPMVKPADLLQFAGNGSACNQFTLERIGSKEGQQIAHGLFMPDNRAVAKHYRAAMANKPSPDLYKGSQLNAGGINALIADSATNEHLRAFLSHHRKALVAGGDVTALVRESIEVARTGIDLANDAIRRAEAGEQLPMPVLAYRHSLDMHKATLGWLLNNQGHFAASDRNVASLNAHPQQHEYLDWDRSITTQSEQVRVSLGKTGFDGHFEVIAEGEPDVSEAFTNRAETSLYATKLESAGYQVEILDTFAADHPVTTGKGVYRSLSNILGGDKAASDHLAMLGIPGVRYSDRKGETRFVLFQEAEASAAPATPSLERQPGLVDAQLRLPLNQVGGVTIAQGITESRATLREAANTQRTRLAEKVKELTARLAWASRVPNISERVIAGTRVGITAAREASAQMGSYKLPNAQNTLPWDAPIGKHIAHRVNQIAQINASAMNGQQVFYFLATHLGSNDKACAELAKVGLIGAYSDDQVVLWDKGSLALADALENAAELERFHLAFHGSSQMFDQFSLDHVGEGEGAQAHGHGLYFAQRKTVAGHYQNSQVRDAHWYEEEFHKSSEDLANVIAPRVAAEYPELAGGVPGFNQLMSALRRVIHLVGHSTEERLEAKLSEFDDATKAVCRHVIAGIAPVTEQQKGGFFLMPAGGARTINAMTEGERTGLAEITAAVKWKLRPDMSQDEMQSALAKSMMVACDQTHWITQLAKINARLSEKPGDDYLLSRKEDLSAFALLAEKAQQCVRTCSPITVQKPLGFGNVYIVDISILPYEYLRHDLKFCEQSLHVQKALRSIADTPGLTEAKRGAIYTAIAENATGGQIHSALAGRQTDAYAIAGKPEDEKLATQQLMAAGVKGIQYPDGELSMRGQTFNYVVFDDANLSVLGHTSDQVRSEFDQIPLYDWTDTDALEQAQLNRAATMR